MNRFKFPTRLVTAGRRCSWRGLLTSAVLLLWTMQGGGLAPQALPPAERGIAAGWLAVHADAPLTFANMAAHNLRLSPIAPNYPQVVYGGDHLYYAYKDAGGWHTETVDSEWGVGRGAALALDASGKAHISYYDSSGGNLKYATNRSGAWQVESVVLAGDAGAYSDIAIDAWGDPAIVYFNATSGELHYISYDSEYGDWGQDTTIDTVSSPAAPNHWFSLAIDTSQTPNRPHVSYYKKSSSLLGYLRYAHTNSSGLWVNEQVDSCVYPPSDCRIGESNAISLDPTSSNRPVIAYSYHDSQLSDLLMYMAYNGSNWVRDYVIPAALPSYVSLAIDTTGHAHVSYKDTAFRYAYRSAQEDWSEYTLDPSASAGNFSSLAVAGVLARVTAFDSTSGAFKYFGHERSGWLAAETLASLGHDVGKCASLAVDALGRAHISYFDASSSAILYARLNNDFTWFKNSAASGGTISCYSVIAANPVTNDPSVGFIRNGDLMYALGTSWTSPMQVDTGVNPGMDYQSFAMRLASNGAPHFVYRKGADLWYAYWSGSGWARAQIATGSVGSHVALALDSGNQPHIAFYQGPAPSVLKYMVNSSGWKTESIADSGTSGSGVGAAIAVAPNGEVLAAFLNAGGTDLRVARRTCSPLAPGPCSWSAGLLIDDEAEEYFSLVMDRSGTAHIATMTWNSTSYLGLDYLTCQNGTWRLQRVDTNAGAGWQPAIGLSPGGAARIGYYDSNNRDLKFALKLDTVFLPVIRK